MLIKYKKLYYTVLIVICASILIPLISTNNLWGDEAFTVLLMRMNFADMIQATANDVHPPLYYIIAKCFTSIFGVNLTILRIVSIIPTVLTMILGATVVDEEFGENSLWIPSIFIIALIGAPNLFHAAFEVRMYSWTMFFVTATALLSYRIYRKKSAPLEIFCICINGLGAAYSHYFGLVAVTIIYAVFFLALILNNKKNLKVCGMIMAVSFIGYLPWLKKFYSQLRNVSGDYWIPELTGHHIMNFLEHSLVNETGIVYGNYMWLLKLLLLFTVLYGIYSIWCNRGNEKIKVTMALCYILLIYVVALAGIILSWLVRPILLERYLTPCLPVFWLGVAMLIYRMKYSKVFASMLIIAFLFNIQCEYQVERGDVIQEGMNAFSKEIYCADADNTVLLTDIFVLSWTLLDYHFPEYETESMEKIDSIKDIVEYPYVEGKKYYIFTKQKLAIEEMDDSVEVRELNESFVPETGIVYLYQIK